ncbi:GNAT family N-acetyltransferase [Umezawaea endophytica]|uniref:GNAT family N-acetyltransferase n=1 Tax=Umezawaea endophytica TaxID=1654476 RepID=A0A9X2VK59_9PSEU|nr:GNAT family N-acetyltransferase [Umezawaea endophytica]MCS7478135.1 GNAT family N-acetyltransferase [Umezawaea endophytica]
MTVGRGLLDTQSAYFASFDPLLPPMPDPPDGDVLTAALPDGTRVAGVLRRQVHDRTSLVRLWSATEVWELTPLLGATGGHGMDALLRSWRKAMDRVGTAEPDSSCVVTWPSRDVSATKALLAHGLVPLSTAAVRRAAPHTEVRASSTLRIRRARPDDIEATLQLSLAELSYSSQVGSTMARPEAAALKRRSLSERLAANGLVWLAEQDGIAVAMAECAVVRSEPGNGSLTRLPQGRWGYVNCLSVLPGARGGGLGQQLMAHVHRELDRMGTVGTYLYYNPPNPLSSVFWPRQGYRPLWTVWEVRPASALR